MKTLTVRGVTLGAGRPKVIVPLAEPVPDALAVAAHALAHSSADIVEWRVDALYGGRDTATILGLLPQLRAALGQKPLLATCRTQSQGGSAELDAAAYTALGRALCASGCIDLLDAELSAGGQALAALKQAAAQNGVALVISHHSFAHTPPLAEMTALLDEMCALGADVAKLAVMPQTRADVAALLAATAQAADRHPDVPLITMSMGKLGMVSRLCGEAFGSAATFARAGRASAPGQPDLDKAQSILSALHDGLA